MEGQMKRKLFFMLLIMIFGSVFAFGQNTVAESVEECVNAIGKPLPSGYTRVHRMRYEKENKNAAITIEIENGIVAVAIIENVFQTAKEADIWLLSYYEYMEQNNNWQYSPSLPRRGDNYFTSKTTACFYQPSRNLDGFITASIRFEENLM
jgi:hypothetical protein